MSLHRSLKTKPTALNQHRNVLTRAERIAKLTESEKFIHGKTAPVGLPKVANRMIATGKKSKKEEGEEGEGAAATPATAAAAPAGKAAAGGKK